MKKNKRFLFSYRKDDKTFSVVRTGSNDNEVIARECSNVGIPNQQVKYIIHIEREKLGLVIAQCKAFLGDQEIATAKIKGFLKA